VATSIRPTGAINTFKKSEFKAAGYYTAKHLIW